MSKKIISLILILYFSTNLYSQLYVSGFYGVGKYSMAELKDLNNDYNSSFPVSLGLVDDFPARPYYGIEVSQKFNKIEFGGEVFYNTTGSKVHYKDYSGEVIFTQKVSATSLGGLFRYYLIDNKIFGWNIKLGVTASNTKLGLYETISVFDETIEETFNFTSIEFRGNIGTEISYAIKMICISVLISGEKTLFASEFSWTDDSQVKLENQKGDGIKPNWSGLRYGFKLGVNIHDLLNL